MGRAPPSFWQISLPSLDQGGTLSPPSTTRPPRFSDLETCLPNKYVYSKKIFFILFQGICMVCSIKIIQLPLSLLESLQLLVLFSCVWSIGWKPQQQTLAALSMSVLKSLIKMNWNVATPHHQWFRVWLQQQPCQSKVIYCLNLNLF